MLHEYTLTDRGTWLSSCEEVRSSLSIFAKGEDISELLNPAHVLLGKLAAKDEPNFFLEWVKLPDGGQKVVKDFEKEGQQLYSAAPTDKDLPCCKQG